LNKYVLMRLSALARYIEHTTAGGKAILARSVDEASAVISGALFQNRLAITCELEFYEQAAAVIRDHLVAGLVQLKPVPGAGDVRIGGLAAGTRSTARREVEPEGAEQLGEHAWTKVAWWCIFHREAAKLPNHLRAVHDMMYYFNLAADRTAAVLGKSPDAVEKSMDVAVHVLRPVFDKARGKV
jgi:hypothetical protein